MCFVTDKEIAHGGILEFDVDLDTGLWYAMLLGEPGSPMGRGDTVWEAIAACIADIEPSLTRHRKLGEVLDAIKRGEVPCKECGKPIEWPDEQHPFGSFMHCRACDAPRLAKLAEDP